MMTTRTFELVMVIGNLYLLAFGLFGSLQTYNTQGSSGSRIKRSLASCVARQASGSIVAHIALGMCV